jgi:hypothetical protein
MNGVSRAVLPFPPSAWPRGGRYAFDIVGHRRNGAFTQLNICFVLARNVRVLKKEQPITTPLGYQIGNLRIAAHRTAPATLSPYIVFLVASHVPAPAR